MILLVLLTVLLAAPVADARTPESPFSMEVLVDGMPLREYAARGTRYVEAREGAEYAIRLSNRTGQRVAIAVSVDGLNTIDAETTSARRASKWIVEPWQTLTIDGWQTSGDTARKFFFTTEPDSYGAWMGKTENLGVISAAVFKEKVRFMSQKKSRIGRAAPAPSAGESSAGLSDDHAATGIGDEVRNPVRRVKFESESRPAAVLTVRYEYRDALARLGVLSPDPLVRRERARGFEDFSFAPDPFAR